MAAARITGYAREVHPLAAGHGLIAQGTSEKPSTAQTCVEFILLSEGRAGHGVVTGPRGTTAAGSRARPVHPVGQLKEPGRDRLAPRVVPAHHRGELRAEHLAVARNTIIDPPKDDPRPRKPWTAQTVWLVRDEHPEIYRPVVDCQAGLGARQNEALALAEEDFDFDAMKAHIRRQISLVGGKSYFKLPKEGRDRWVPLPRGVAAVIRAHIQAHPPVSYELPWLNEDGSVAKEPHVCRLLFRWQSSNQHTSGKHVKAALFRDKMWNPALVRAGVLELAEGETLGSRHHRSTEGNGTHIARHFYATTLQDAGISPVGVTSRTAQ